MDESPIFDGPSASAQKRERGSIKSSNTQPQVAAARWATLTPHQINYIDLITRRWAPWQINTPRCDINNANKLWRTSTTWGYSRPPLKRSIWTLFHLCCCGARAIHQKKFALFSVAVFVPEAEPTCEQPGGFDLWSFNGGRIYMRSGEFFFVIRLDFLEERVFYVVLSCWDVLFLGRLVLWWHYRDDTSCCGKIKFRQIPRRRRGVFFSKENFLKTSLRYKIIVFSFCTYETAVQ